MPRTSFPCDYCDGEGFVRSRVCPVCQGMPQIDYARFSMARAQAEDLTLQMGKMRLEINRLRRKSPKVVEISRTAKVTEIRELDRMFRIDPPEAA